jgi:hypothetical protein
MAKTKEDRQLDGSPPNPNDGFLCYLMDRQMWIFAILLVPISLIYDLCIKINFVINLWKDRSKARILKMLSCETFYRVHSKGLQKYKEYFKWLLLILES